MAGEALTAPGAGLDRSGESNVAHEVLRALLTALAVGGIMLAVAAVLELVLNPVIASAQVDETVTSSLAAVLVALLIPVTTVTFGVLLRPLAVRRPLLAVLLVSIMVVALYGVWIGVQSVTQTGVFGVQKTLQFTFSDTPEGVRVESLEPGGAAETAGLLVGDIITAIRRNPVDAAGLATAIAETEVDGPLRLRLVRNGEEIQLTARVVEAASVNTSAIYTGLVLSLLAAVGLGLFWPGRWTPYALLILILLPLFAGYTWLIVATFSYRTEGLLPVDSQGNVGGLTLSNWDFLSGQGIAGQSNQSIWPLTLNSLIIAVVMTVLVLLISSMAGYALARMNFPGRRLFLSFTLILHGFPAVTLIIPIFLVLIAISNLPLIGKLFGFNTLGGIALVMVAFDLPLGVWLMKGFFDNIPWDMERSALIDGASRWRTFFEVILPQIRPGLLALGIFAFVGGWNAYLIPATYSIGEQTSNLPVLIRSLTGDVNPVNWNMVAAVGTFQLIPILVFFIFAQEYLLNIYAGGTKGSS